MEHHLSEDEKYRVQIQVDHFLQIIETRYGISAQEASELLRWARSQRERNARLGQAGAFSLIGLVITALGISIAEGVREWFRKG
jgi:hypothetical protein